MIWRFNVQPPNFLTKHIKWYNRCILISHKDQCYTGVTIKRNANLRRKTASLCASERLERPVTNRKSLLPSASLSCLTCAFILQMTVERISQHKFERAELSVTFNGKSYRGRVIVNAKIVGVIFIIAPAIIILSFHWRGEIEVGG